MLDELGETAPTPIPTLKPRVKGTKLLADGGFGGLPCWGFLFVIWGGKGRGRHTA